MNRKISIISPASSYLDEYPNRVQRGVEFLKKEGFDVKFEKNASKQMSYYSAKIDERIRDINNALNDNNTDIIMASIGGYNSNQLLERLDYNRIYKSNKIFCGYSDITSLILAIYCKTNRIVLHGPTFLPEICEYPEPYDYTWNCFKEVLDNRHIKYEIPKYEIKEFVDWKEQEENPVKRKKEKNEFLWKISKKGNARGKIIGGNLSSILTIIGTEYLPIEIFEDKILFIEDVNISIAEFDSFMQSLKLRKIFDKINGLIIGKFVENENNNKINDFLEEFFEDYNFPIIYNVDIGHTTPQLTIPIGAFAYLECDKSINFGIEKY